MKKKVLTGIVLSAVIISNMAVFASESEAVLTSSAQEEEPLVGVPVITVDKETVDLTGLNLSHYIFEENGNVMVPLRAVAEKMGYTVVWDGENQSVSVGDDEWEVVAYIGLDSYAGMSKTAIGMTSPQHYGAAPQLIDGTTYAPAKMFELLDYTYSSIGQFVDFMKKDTGENVQIPNPFAEYENMEAVKKALSFEPAVPSELPKGFELNEITAVGNDFLQIIYKDENDNNIFYRMAKGSGDISGDYNIYKINEKASIGDLTVTMRGNDKISNAIWSSGEFTYSIYSDAGFEKAEIIELIGSIQ